MLKYILLGFLNYAPMTGYDLKKHIDGSTSHFWHAKQSQIYSVLKALEKEGMILTVQESLEEDGKHRFYEITPQGEKVLLNWLEKPALKLDKHKVDFLVKLFFSARVSPDFVLSQFQIQKKLHQQQLEIYQTETKELISEFADYEELENDSLYWEYTRRFGEMYEQMCLQWIDEILGKLKE